MTSKNNPSVRIVIGKDKNCNIGFSIAFRIPSTIATRIDVPKLFTETPGSNHAVKYTATLEIRICKIKLIWIDFI
jgi:hypothetical protein